MRIGQYIKKTNHAISNVSAISGSHIVKLLFWVLIFWSLFHVKSSMTVLREFDDIYTIFCNGNVMTGSQAEDIQKHNLELDDQKAFAIWGTLGNTMVMNKQLNRSKEVEVIVVNGRTDIIFPEHTWLDQNDFDQCLIDSKTAIELYGSSDVKDVELIYNEKIYIVKGVLENTRDTLILESNSEKVIGLNKVTIKVDENTSEKEIKRKMETKYNVTGTVLSYRMLTDCIELMSLILPILIGIHFISELIKNIKRTFKVKLECLIWCTVLAIFVVLFAILVCSQINISQDYIPTRWSDFGFWSSFWKEKQSAIMVMFKMSKSSSEVNYSFAFIKAVILLVIVNISYLFVCRHQRKIPR